jgi:hypothetical protein
MSLTDDPDLTSLSTKNLKPIKKHNYKELPEDGKGHFNLQNEIYLSTLDNEHVECKLLATLHEFETSLH